jgi:predicted nucleic acid-binding protein
VIVYAESSAILAWLLGELSGKPIAKILAGAERIVASTLTAVECGRALARGVRTGQLGVTDELAAQQLLDRAARSWITLEMTGRVLDRARATFPREPVRTLDAIHLATAGVFHEAHGNLTVASVDELVRGNATSLGWDVAP